MAWPRGKDPRRVDGLAQEIEPYRGSLLPGYSDDWIVAEQQRLEEAFHRTVSALDRHWERAGDPFEAARWMRRALTADPLREEAHHELIRLLIGAGQTDAAFAHFQELERLLAAHLGARPAEETAALPPHPSPLNQCLSESQLDSRCP